MRTARIIFESKNCVMASISFPGKYVRHIKEQGEVMTSGNGMLRGKGGATGAAATKGQRRHEGGKW